MKCLVSNCYTNIEPGAMSTYCPRCLEEIMAFRKIKELTNPHPILIGLGYKMEHGKDTVADHLVRRYGFVKVGFADALKDAVASMYGWKRELLDDQTFKRKYDEYWDCTPRQALQKVGQSMRDNIDRDIWVRSCIIRIIESGHKRVVISDMRYINEVKAIQDLQGWDSFAVHVDRGNHRPNVEDASIFEHESETALDYYYDFDYVIDNNGTHEQLIQGADEMIEDMMSSRLSQK